MGSYSKASAILLLVEGENGHMAYGINWPKSPPPSWPKITAVLAEPEDGVEEDEQRTFEAKFIADNKTALKTLVESFIDDHYAT